RRRLMSEKREGEPRRARPGRLRRQPRQLRAAAVHFGFDRLERGQGAQPLTVRVLRTEQYRLQIGEPRLQHLIVEGFGLKSGDDLVHFLPPSSGDRDRRGLHAGSPAARSALRDTRRNASGEATLGAATNRCRMQSEKDARAWAKNGGKARGQAQSQIKTAPG